MLGVRLVSCLLLLCAPIFARAECLKRRAALLPLVLWQQKIFVRAEIEGRPTFLFIDTGAAATTLSKSIADGLDLPRDFDHAADIFGVGGVESHLSIVRAHSLSLASVQVVDHDYPVASFDRPMADGTPVGGLIGADILSRFDVDLDIAHRTLGLWRVSGCADITPDWPGADTGVALDISPSRHASIPVRIDGALLDLLVDTGAPALVLSTRAAARAGATPDILEQNRRLEGRGVNDRPFGAWLHIFGRLEVAGEVFGDVRALVVAPGRVPSGDGLLGLEFLKRGRVWLSYSTGRFFIQPTH